MTYGPDSKDAVLSAPPPQLCKTAPSGSRTRKHRTGPHPSHPCRLLPARTPGSDWGRPSTGSGFDRLRIRQAQDSTSPAGVALQAPVSTDPRSHPSTPTRASRASLQVRGRRRQTPWPTGANPWCGIRSEQPSIRRASTRAAAWCTLSLYLSMNFTRPITELKAGST